MPATISAAPTEVSVRWSVPLRPLLITRALGLTPLAVLFVWLP